MKQFEISLCLVTVKSIRTEQIKKIIKNKKIRLTSREDDSEKVWWIEFSNAQKKTILDQIRDIVLSLSSVNLVAIEKQLNKIYFDIVVLYDTYTCSVDLSYECIKIVTEFYSDTGIHITCYPSTEDNEESE